MPSRQLFFVFVLIFIAGFLIWLIIKDFPEKIETGKQLGDLKSKIEALKKEEEGQKNLAEYLSSDSYLEKQARIRLNLKKVGEEVVFVYRKDETPEQGSAENKSGNPFLSKLKELFRFLFD
ncbi:MAG: septum formation initiator family protein [Parcubacteria group bacterium]|nr:septum formation initiator family protein [Parcubacteria group bacterium]